VETQRVDAGDAAHPRILVRDAASLARGEQRARSTRNGARRVAAAARTRGVERGA